MHLNGGKLCRKLAANGQINQKPYDLACSIGDSLKVYKICINDDLDLVYGEVKFDCM